MMQLDDLRALIERGGLLGETHHQYRSDGEVGCDQDADTVMPRQEWHVADPAGSSVKPVVPTTAWMPWSMHQERLSITASG